MEFDVFEMHYTKKEVQEAKISCTPFDVRYFEEYKRIYNECFYDMRKALERVPVNVLADFKQIEEKAKDIYLLIENGEICGSVACYENEVDDLVVNKKFQHMGYGKQMLFWAMAKIRERSEAPIKLHVVDWNTRAYEMYKKAGFETVNVLHIGGK